MPGSTPNRQYPYPLGTDPIDVAMDIKRLADAIDADHRKVGARMRRVTPALNGNGGGGETVVTWDTEDYDSDGFGAVGGNVLTVPAGLGGVYAFLGTHVVSGGGATGNLTIYASIKGSKLFTAAIGRANGTQIGVSGVLTLAPGDTVGFINIQTTGTTANFIGTYELWRLLK